MTHIKEMKNEIINPLLVLKPKPAKPKILIVDDCLNYLFLFKEKLKNSYEIILADNGQIALENLENMSICPSIIISEIDMPVLDGLQLIVPRQLTFLQIEQT